MPYASNHGTRIHYELEGEGEPLVLVHGLTSDLESWRDYGYTEALNKERRLLLIDARGHGSSGKPHDPAAYDDRLRVGDVLAVLEDVGVTQADYIGYSMGGRIGFACAAHAPERFRSFMLGGIHPYRRDPGIGNQRVLAFSQGMEAYVANREKSGPIPPKRRASLLRNDPQALIAATTSNPGHPGYADILPKLTVPCLLYCGDGDPSYEPAKRAAAEIPSSTFAAIPGVDHLQCMARSELVLPHVVAFLRAHGRRPAAAEA